MGALLPRPADLIESARTETRLDVFADESFREGLEVLVRALREEAPLHPIGELALPAHVVNLLGERFPIEDWSPPS
jgi:hypothetical protein